MFAVSSPVEMPTFCDVDSANLRRTASRSSLGADSHELSLISWTRRSCVQPLCNTEFTLARLFVYAQSHYYRRHLGPTDQDRGKSSIMLIYVGVTLSLYTMDPVLYYQTPAIKLNSTQCQLNQSLF